MRDHFARRALPGLRIGPLEDSLRGPHPQSMFELDFGGTLFAEIVQWLTLHRGPHTVLVHAVTGNDVVDHDRHTLWLGDPLPLDSARLDPPVPGWQPVQPQF
jgi:DOPA 4,5-dioxygenase